MDIKRILIFGRPGSGKSTFAFKLHHKLKIPLYHLDKYFFQKNWIPNNYNNFLQIQKKLVKNKKWIIDGNNPDSLEIRYSQCNICLYFNYPKIICLWRACKRLFNKNKQIQDRAKNCKEQLDYKLIHYIWCFEHRVKNIIPKLKAQYPHVYYIEINNDRILKQVYSWITNIQNTNP